MCSPRSGSHLVLQAGSDLLHRKAHLLCCQNFLLHRKTYLLCCSQGKLLQAGSDLLCCKAYLLCCKDHLLCTQASLLPGFPPGCKDQVPSQVQHL